MVDRWIGKKGAGTFGFEGTATFDAGLDREVVWAVWCKVKFGT